MKHILPTELVNRVLAYLATRPYTEVTLIIKDIQGQAVPFTEASETEVSKDVADLPNS